MKSPNPSARLLCLAAILLIVVSAGAASGVTRYVHPLGWPYSSYDNLEEAIEASSDGDEVVARDGVFTGEGNRNIICGGKAITIRSENGPEHTTIDLAGDGTMRQFIRFQHSEGHDTVLEGLTIINGNARYYPVGSGGGVYCSASPTIRNCVFIDCEANVGGAIEVFNPDDYICAPDIIDCTFIRCSGYAICCAKNAQPYIEGCKFYDNPGYALKICGYENVDVTITECFFDGYLGRYGINCEGPATITNCTLVRNGSAITVNGPEADVVFERNIVAFNNGYGVNCTGTGEAVLLSCNDFWENELEGQDGDCVGTFEDNFSANPRFCSDWSIREDSPCIPENNDCGVLVGAFDVGCEYIPPPPPPPPSCPVLYVAREGEFHAENTLLTACEETGYRYDVTDYYRLPDDVRPVDGTFAFQLREMEDEISYVRELELIAVRHEAGTRAECSVDGGITVYEQTLAPLSAVDQDGVDHLAAVASEDGELFSSEGPGELTLEFPCPAGGIGTICLRAANKGIKACAAPHITKAISPDGAHIPIRLGFEVRQPDGVWSGTSSTPPREWAHQEAFTAAVPPASPNGTFSVRVTWDGPYETDAVLLALPAGEPLSVETHRVSSHALERVSDLNPVWLGFDAGDALVLRNGDVLEFAFDVEEDANSDEVTTYVLKAEGRYEPDYDVHAHLKPQAFELLGNFPNPFNPSTRIQYDLPTDARVKIAVYDAAGRRVATLVDGLQTAGRKSVDWQGLDDTGNPVASGVYFCRMNAGGDEQKVKMMLMK